MDQCPKCHRKLLSHTSPRCSWCGEEISDPNYQEQAEAERQAFFAKQQAHDALSLARIGSINMNQYDPQMNSGTNAVKVDSFPVRRAERNVAKATEAFIRAKLPSKARVEAYENHLAPSEAKSTAEPSQTNVNAGFQDLPESSNDIVKGRFRDLD